jgi:hypothetical protein
MPDFASQILRHDRLYLPWTEQRPLFELGSDLAALIARERRLRLTVAAPSTLELPEAVQTATAVTERSGTLPRSGLTVVYCPTPELMRKVDAVPGAVVLLVEWGELRFSGWAKLEEAFNLSTVTRMGSRLGAEGRAGLQRALAAGAAGWRDPATARLTFGELTELARRGEYERDVVLESGRRRLGPERMDRLVALLDAFERGRH